MKIVDVARICHEANKAYCETLKDYSQWPWDSAPEWQKESAINGVKFIVRNNGKVDPEAQHENWMILKLAQGWQYGNEKNADKKTHPCLLPYADLPEEQRIKDHLFGAIVNWLYPFIEDKENAD